MKRVSLAIVGCGGVGSAFLGQLAGQQRALIDLYSVEVAVRAICASRTMVIDRAAGIDLSRWQRSAMDQATDLDEVSRVVTSGDADVAVIVDCTASDQVTGRYASWLDASISIITANKKAMSGPYDLYRRLRAIVRAKGARFLYEANVGAGLPILRTLQAFAFSGDRVLTIEGILSGTLSFIFNELTDATPLSSIVVRARQMGYTEPDPREDLAGTDVARKVVILAREVGLQPELISVPTQSLVPAPLRDPRTVSVDQFLDALPAFDDGVRDQASAAAARGSVLRYVGVIDVAAGTCTVELREYPRAHPFGRLQGSDNIISIRTERYNQQPLVIQGPGAGNAVTAGGLFADLQRLV